MVSITVSDETFIFKINGFHQIWSLKSKINVPRNNIIRAYQDNVELTRFPGIRLGTHIPFVITAGTYYKNGKRNFWNVMNKKKQLLLN